MTDKNWARAEFSTDGAYLVLKVGSTACRQVKKEDWGELEFAEAIEKWGDTLHQLGRTQERNERLHEIRKALLL